MLHLVAVTSPKSVPSLEQVFRISLTFITLTLLKVSGQLFGLFVYLKFIHVLIPVMHLWQEYYRNDDVIYSMHPIQVEYNFNLLYYL